MASRKPSQEEDLLQQADESLGNEPIDISGNVGETDKEQTPAIQDRTANDALARGLAGAAPALMGFLFGASPASAAMQIDEAKKFYKEGAPKKLVTIVGPDGNPTYEDARMAVGEQAFQKKALNSAANSFQFGIGFNKATNKYEQLKANTRTGELVFADGTPITDARNWIFKPVKESEHVFENIGGGKDLIARNQYTDNAKSKYHSEGIGERLREPSKEIMPKQEAEQYYKNIEKGMDKTVPIREELGTLKRLDTALRNPSVSPQELSNAIETLKRTAGEKRLSDKESERAEGDRYMTVADQVSDVLTRRLQGKEREEKLSGFRSLLFSMINEKQKTLKTIKNVYVPPTKSKYKQQTEERAFRGVESDDTRSLQDNQLNSILNKLQGL